MTHVLDWKRADDPRDVVHLAVQALAEGHLVGLPTDTLYNLAASGIQSSASEQLAKLRIPSSNNRPTLALRSVTEVFDYCPKISHVGSRLAKCVWPGPLALVVDGSDEDSLIRRLPSTSRSLLLDPKGRVTLRTPAHDAVAHVMHLLAGPLILLAAPTKEHPTGAEAVRLPEVALSIDDGVTHFQGPSTCVEVIENRCRILSEGVLDRNSLQAMSQFVILLVCTGNTCRSPMAERLLQAKLEKRFAAFTNGNSIPPVVAKSAGVSAMAGGRASKEAVDAMNTFGLDLRKHHSTPISERLLSRADIILTMTSNHRHAILSRWPEFEGKTFPIGPDGREVSDPFGGTVDVYLDCAKQLDRYLDSWVDRIPTDGLAIWVD